MSNLRRLLVAYDVSTRTLAGQRRLRRVAQLCCGFGVRVQQSLFECDLTQGQEARLLVGLLDVIDQGSDNLRIYHIRRDGGHRLFGVTRHLDLDDLLLL